IRDSESEFVGNPFCPLPFFGEDLITISLCCLPCLSVRQVYQTYGETVLGVAAFLGGWRPGNDI
ncbi:hypothetical protein CEN46_14815, partial [Fischerella thermalis CCMEE 5318]